MTRQDANRGRLLVVGTPIGNLGDLTPRAADALRTADLVVAEDTRMAARLLAHVGGGTRTISFNEHNAAGRLPALLGRLAAGETLALTTDAGMPAVSDPGAQLVAAARKAGASVLVVPGPTAVTAAMAMAGAEAPGFVFGGFLPSRPASARAGALKRLVEAAGALNLPLILYESPHRVAALLSALAELAPDAQVAAGRELTKRHEQVVVGTPPEVMNQLGERRGEFTLVLSRLPAPGPIGGPDLGALLAAGRQAG
ncbi:MAG TPA: 16S rRNA (cytidine(1402)-2'-O)-methyltransferase, partial [Candidatus Limnocylindrales bacterium]|nr:16S rRNA (cytidine(1402)-2'-O)-methyltransferase [Candidatus Limnocylindrales bacterium]